MGGLNTANGSPSTESFSGEYAYFEEIRPIVGFPAVANDITDERNSGICPVTVGAAGGDDDADHEGGIMTGTEGAIQGVIYLQRSQELLVHRAVNDVRPAGSLDESFPFDEYED